jgi:hypothetical protein
LLQNIELITRRSTRNKKDLTAASKIQTTGFDQKESSVPNDCLKAILQLGRHCDQEFKINTSLIIT